RGVHFRGGVVDSDATRLFLLLLLGVVRGQIRRDAIPCLSVIARSKKKLGADINCPFLVWRQGDGRVPIPPQFFLVVRLGLNVAALMCAAIAPADVSTLSLGIQV